MPFLLKHYSDSSYRLHRTIVGILAMILSIEPQPLLPKYRPYSTLNEVSRDSRLAPHWQMRSRRRQHEVKTLQDASETSNMFNPQDSLATPSQHLATVLRSPHTAKTRLRRACDASVASASQASLKRIFAVCGLLRAISIASLWDLCIWLHWGKGMRTSKITEPTDFNVVSHRPYCNILCVVLCVRCLRLAMTQACPRMTTSSSSTH